MPRLTTVGSALRNMCFYDNFKILKGFSYHNNWGLIITGGGIYKPAEKYVDEIELTVDGESFSDLPFKIPGLNSSIAAFFALLIISQES